MSHDKISKVFVGPFIHSKGLKQLEIVPFGAIGVSIDGKIAFVKEAKGFDGASGNKEAIETWLRSLKNEYGFTEDIVTMLGVNQFLLPGFIDTHTHAPQYVNSGLGLDLPLLDWLRKYTFPKEEQFNNVSMADRVYPAAIRRHVSFGTTTCCYYGTIHLESTKRLVDLVQMVGQRALIGKVNMDKNSPPDLTEDTKRSVQETKEFVEYVLAKKDSRLIPCITPRFAPSCTDELMKSLGGISRHYKTPIQSHLSENVAECEWVKDLFPDCSNYASVYDKFGLLTEKTIMAHCIYLSDEEIKLLKDRGVGVSHCPNSNFGLSSGICNVRRLLTNGVKVGLGTDVSGGHHPSMLDAMKHAILASKLLPKEEALTVGEVFYLATMGSAEICGLKNTVGNFEFGKDFDAVLVNIKQLSQIVGEEVKPHHHKIALELSSNHHINNIDLWDHDDLSTAFERFVYLADDRNIEKVFVKGQIIKNSS
ncbi:hypothetical protein MP638_006223 [Amoeboaphelidium occidentale]|nr:hypothetical protein MP638_006223 [Amoeboaphelidium occidentale]